MSFIRFRCFLGLLLVAGFSSLSVGYANDPYYEEEETPFRLPFFGPAERSPERQLTHADGLRERGRLRGAERAYRALVRFWPNTQEAAQAQYAYAMILLERGKLTRAFEEFEKLMEQYTGLFPHEEVLTQKLRIARELMGTRKGRWLFFPGFEAPERALPLLERIVENGPQWEHAPTVYLLIAEIQETLGEAEAAIAAYDVVETRYPRSEAVVDAAYGKARIMTRLAERYPRHIEGVETAYYTVMSALQQYPRAPQAEQARADMLALRNSLGAAAYQRARYYDRTAQRPAAAIIMYERFIEQFPDSPWAEAARNRLDQLKEASDDSET
jgi:outer membrane protein assembly factor BamD (BamD/ComL family)